MTYKYFITNEMLHKVQQGDFGSMAMNRLRNFLRSNKENVGMNTIPLCDGKIIKNAPKSKSGIRFFWLKKIEEDVCLYILRAMYRHNSEYDALSYHNKLEQRQLLEDFSLTTNEKNQVQKYLDTLKDADIDMDDNHVIQKPELSVEEHKFLDEQLSINHRIFDTLVFELDGWIRAIKSKEESVFDEFSKKIYEYILCTPNGSTGWDKIKINKEYIDVYQSNNDFVLAGIRSVDDSDTPSYIPESKDYKRGYPATDLESPINWMRMEKSDKSNMWLTDKQIELLSDQTKSYPYFITGRAGSGKSTMLQYLFAETIVKYIIANPERNNKLLQPIYISYNHELVDTAAKAMEKFFLHNKVYKDCLEKYQISYDKDIKPFLNIPKEEYLSPKEGMMFYTFGNLLRLCASKLDSEFISSRFTRKNHVSYDLFERLWYKNPTFKNSPVAKKEYGPSISWYVIRTYIKGWNSDSYMDDKMYETEVPEDRQTVEISTFRKVYENVWEKWYKPMTVMSEDEENEDSPNYWDDQDLALWCLQTDCAKEFCSAVFCDEAQDFTRIELEFILNISSLANRSISSGNEVQKFPFIFVGDEFQTLNPTGFSWESLKDCFWEYLKSQTGCGDIQLKDTKVLKENHRSKSPIVRFANKIQLLRASRFGDNIKQPQDVHFTGSVDVVCSPLDNTSLWTKFNNNEVCVITPLPEDINDRKGYLRSKYPCLKNTELDKVTILSPAEAKGNEYPNVALIGFNYNSEPLKLNNLLRWFEKEHSDKKTRKESEITLRFQISNAYVAATRATDGLFILDEINRDSLWAFAFDAHECSDNSLRSIGRDAELLEERMLSRVSNPSEWRDKLGSVIYNEDPEVGEENVEYYRDADHLNELEKKATSKYMFDELARKYRNLENIEIGKVGEHRCKAKGWLLDHDYLKAADEFVKAKEPDSAAHCYWMEIANVGVIAIETISSVASIIGCKEERNVIFTKIAVAAQKKVNIVKTCRILTEVCENIEKGADKDDLCVWNLLVNCLLKRMYSIKTDSSCFNGLRDILDKLNVKGVTPDCLSDIALQAYNCEVYDVASSIWENSKTIKPKEYFEAKLLITDYPERLGYYEGTKDSLWYHRVIEDYREHKSDFGVINTTLLKNILLKSVRLDSDSTKEYKKLLPHMLSYAGTYDKAKDIIVDYCSRKDAFPINVDCVEAAVSAYFNILDGWNVPSKQYSSLSVRPFFDAVELVKKLRSDAKQCIDDIVKYHNGRIKDVCIYYKSYLSSPMGILVFIELGKAFEERGKFSEATLFFKHAAMLMENENYKRRMRIGHLHFLYKYAETRKEETDKEHTLEEANSLRNMLDYNGDLKTPEMTAFDWMNIYEYACRMDSTIKETVKRTVEEEKAEISNLNEGKTIVGDEVSEPKTPSVKDAASGVAEIFKFQYAGFTIIYRSREGDLKLRDENEASGHLVNGKFNDDDDFYLKKGHVVYSNSDEPTPFMFKYDNKKKTITFKIEDDND